MHSQMAYFLTTINVNFNVSVGECERGTITTAN